jgi:tRNA A37 threonylcarbamoyladenosine synthetase subunit TsaC/SUA5/YrdC
MSGETSISNKILTAVDFTFGNIKDSKDLASTIVDTTSSPIKILRKGSLSINNL